MTEAQKPAGEATQAETKPTEPKHNISSVARAAILEGLSNADALARVQAEFPDAKTTVASIAWYRNDLRKKGHDVKSPARPKKEKPAKAETAADAKAETKAKPTKPTKAASAPEAPAEFE